jgi:hydroxymethylbilane synthase
VRSLRIATRKSPLALWQARHVGELLRKHHAAEVVLVEMTTAGDRFLQGPLAQIGGKGLFTQEIETALLNSQADLAVHSLKDMTSALPPELCLAAVPEREDPRDAFVSPRLARLWELPTGSRVGTSSLRRQCQILERRPDLQIVSLRGNVHTRLRKVSEQKLAGAVLALAGLRRLGLEDQVTQILETEDSLPAVGQGALALECRRDDTELVSALRGLDHLETRTTITAERAFLSRLEGGCTVPLAGHATLRGAELLLRGLVGSPDGRTVVRGHRAGAANSADEIGRSLAEDLLDRGGREILSAFAGSPRQVPDS